jgi:hypothetical protein
MTTTSKVYISCILAAAIAVLVSCGPDWQLAGEPRFAIYLLLTVIAATLKVRLPRFDGTVSLSFLCLLVAVAQFQMIETVLMAIAAAVVQCLWRPKTKPRAIQIAFSAATLVISSALAQTVSHQLAGILNGRMEVAVIAAAAFIFYGANTLLVAVVVCLVESRPLRTVWQQCHLGAFPLYLIGALLLDAMYSASEPVTWKAPLMLLPLMVLAYTWHRAVVERVDEQDQRSAAAAD